MMIKVSSSAKYKIKLTMSDAKKFQASVQEYAKAPTQKLKMQMLDIYTPYINRKVQADTYGKDISKEDYAQVLYLKLLEIIEKIKDRKHKSSNFPTGILNEISPNADDVISLHNSTEITDTNAAERFSYTPEEQTDFQKIKDILFLAKDILDHREYKVLLKRAEGASFQSIATFINTSRACAEQIYHRAVPKIRALVNNTILDEAFFDDKHTDRKVIPADEPLIAREHRTVMPPKTKETSKQELRADFVWKLIQEDLKPVNVFMKLDELLKTQTTSKELMRNISAQTKFRKKLEQNPDFKFQLKLDRRYDSEQFREETARLSTELFGKNVFEFV